MAKVLQSAAGEDAVLQEGESANVVVVFSDINGDVIPKSSLVSLVCTLYDKASKTVVNGRDSQSVLDAHNGVVATDGTLTLRLWPSDVVIVGDCNVGQSKSLCLDFLWTWSDGVETRTGISGPLLFRVEKLATLT